MSFFGRRAKAPDDSKPPDSEETPAPASDENALAPAESPPPTSDTPNPPSKPANSRTFDTALGAGSTLEGTLSSDGNIRLDGKFTGKLQIQQNVLVGVTAEIEADIHAKNVTIAGVVRGNVSGQKVHVLATAHIVGDIQAGSLVTEDGAFIDGRVSMTPRATADALPVIDEDDLA